MAKLVRLLAQAEQHFESAERALGTVLGSYTTNIKGRDHLRSGILVATDQRLLFYAKKLIGQDFETFPYADISSMQVGKNWMGHHITFFAYGNSHQMKWIQHGDVHAFVDAVEAHMTAAKSRKESASGQPTDVVNQLERLAKLHAAGAITDEEFSTKKAELLERL